MSLTTTALGQLTRLCHLKQGLTAAFHFRHIYWQPQRHSTAATHMSSQPIHQAATRSL